MVIIDLLDELSHAERLLLGDLFEREPKLVLKTDAGPHATQDDRSFPNERIHIPLCSRASKSAHFDHPRCGSASCRRIAFKMKEGRGIGRGLPTKRTSDVLNGARTVLAE